MASGSRGRGRRPGAGVLRSSNMEYLNDGEARVLWSPPSDTEEWMQFGITAYDYPITPDEWVRFNEAREAYCASHGVDSPPSYQTNQGADITMSQVLPSRLGKSIDDANAELQDMGRRWLQTMDIQKQKEAFIAQQKELLAKMRCEVREKQKEIKALEDDLIETKESYTDLEDDMHKKSSWIMSIRKIYPYG